MNKEQIRHMVDRFLGWRLPEDFHPDGGVTFRPANNMDREEALSKNWWPVGTNLLTAQQAEDLIRFMLIDLPPNNTKETEVQSFREGYHKALSDVQSGITRDIPPPNNPSWISKNNIHVLPYDDGVYVRSISRR